MTYFSDLTARLGKALGMKGAPAATTTAPHHDVEQSGQPPAATPEATSASPASGA